MLYTDFKTYLRTFLWKQNDADLAASLDNLILMGEGELNRRLDVTRRNVTVLITPTTQDYELPANFRNIISVNNLSTDSKGDFSQTTLMDLYKMRQEYASNHIMPVYAIDQGDDATSSSGDGTSAPAILRLVGPFSVSTPGNLVLVYRANVPRFALLSKESWLVTNYLDLYVYTVLSHTAPFLREDERVSLWMAYKESAITTAIEEDRHNIAFGGSPLQMKPHRRVP